MVQLAPGLRVEVQVLDERVKLAVDCSWTPARAAFPELVTVRVWATETVLRTTLPKVIWVGATVMPPTATLAGAVEGHDEQEKRPGCSRRR